MLSININILYSLNRSFEQLISGGRTAVIAVITKKRLYVTNVGDSRTILVYQEHGQPALCVRQLSEDHGIENDQEIQQLAAIGLDPDKLKSCRLVPRRTLGVLGTTLLKEDTRM